jgi:hypothetical protein
MEFDDVIEGVDVRRDVELRELSIDLSKRNGFRGVINVYDKRRMRTHRYQITDTENTFGALIDVADGYSIDTSYFMALLRLSAAQPCVSCYHCISAGPDICNAKVCLIPFAFR